MLVNENNERKIWNNVRKKQIQNLSNQSSDRIIYSTILQQNTYLPVFILNKIPDALTTHLTEAEEYKAEREREKAVTKTAQQTNNPSLQYNNISLCDMHIKQPYFPPNFLTTSYSCQITSRVEKKIPGKTQMPISC